MKKVPLQIVITNVVALNAGDGAILLGIIKVLRRTFDNFNLTVLDSQATIARRLYPEIQFEQLALKTNYRGVAGRIWRALVKYLGNQRRWLPSYSRNIATYNNADLIISTGGTYLVEHYDLSDRMYQLAFVAASRQPLIMYTQSLGPFTKPNTIKWLQTLMPQVDLVLLRDERSAANLNQIGANAKKMKVVADAAFALANVERVKAGITRSLGKELRVAVSVRSWKHFRSSHVGEALNNYYDGIAKTVEKLVSERGAAVTFISTCQGVPEYWTDDSKAAREIMSLIDPEVRKRVTLNADFHRAEELMEILAGFDMAIATRMHLGILSLCAATPVFPIAYEFKTTELFTNLGLGEWVIEIEGANSSTLPDKVISFLDNLPVIRPKLMESVLSLYESAMTVADMLPAVTG